MTRPTLETERLLLRPFRLDDATEVQRLFKPREIAAATLAIPHPYPEGAAEAWIGRHAGASERGESVDFAIEVRAELGYWIGLRIGDADTQPRPGGRSSTTRFPSTG